uniref:Pre-mRNA-splicing factor n=1 Tax=Clandestinovirus TaxID=2831644 RepID=A0A8F8KPD1_9VIRU|nr:pre-mRNA-splicing factor [Clandestinovirus]
MYQRYLTIVKEWFAEDLDQLRRKIFIDGCTKDQVIMSSAAPESDVEVIYTVFMQGNKPAHRGTWNPTTDNLLITAMDKWGRLKDKVRRFWHLIASCVPPMCSKQCRERWNNQLDPKLDKSEWTKEDEARLFQLVDEFGHSWSLIQRNYYPTRSSNFVKNQYYRIIRQGLPKKKKRSKRDTRSKDSDPEYSEGENDDIEMDIFSDVEEDSHSGSAPSSSHSSTTERKYATRSGSKPVKKFEARTESIEEQSPQPSPQKRKLTAPLIDEDPRPQKRQRVTIDDPMFCSIINEELQGLEKSFLDITIDINPSFNMTLITTNYIDLTAC